MRPGWKLASSSTAPTWALGCGSSLVAPAAEGAVPRVGWMSPSSIRSVVLFPAPFGPRKPVTRPAWTSKDRSVTASTLPKRLLIPRISIAVLMLRTTLRPECLAAASAARDGLRLRLQDERGRTRPTSYAKTTACTRSRSPSLRSTDETCVFTVASVRNSRVAISALESASADEAQHLHLPLGQLAELGGARAGVGSASAKRSAGAG